MIIKNMVGEESMNCDLAMLKGIEVSGYSFHRYYLEKVEVEDATFKDCNFRNAEMKDVNILNTKIISSQLIMLKIENAVIKKCDLSNQLIDVSTFINVDFSGTNFNKTLMKGNKFIDCKFSDADLNCSDIIDCEFVRCTCNQNTSWDEKLNESLCGIEKRD